MQIKTVAILALLSSLTLPAGAQQLAGDGQPMVERVIPGAQILLPDSSVRRPEDRGRRAHTNYRILKRDDAPIAAQDIRRHAVSPQLTKPETPASMACVYRLVAQTMGCDPDEVSVVANGGSKVIAIVDAFHNKTALKDLKKFSATFDLPAPHLQIIYCSDTTCNGVTDPPPENRGWAGEIALDLQWAHAMAPGAKLILVEAHSASFADLMRAVDRAAELVVAQGGGQVSMSWGGPEFANQVNLDDHFVKAGVVFFASTGDHQDGTSAPDVNWPATSPNIVAVGGTVVTRDNAGSFVREEAWIDTGGGKSAIYPRPAFQDVIADKTGGWRGVPDIAWNADPSSGVYVYCTEGTCDSNAGGFFVFGGTSLSAPAIAAMTNAARRFRPSSDAEHRALYNGLGTAKFTDIVKGKCGNGPNGDFVNANSGWDRCTGIGTPRGLGGL